MSQDGERASGPDVNFVWDVPKGAAKVYRSAPGRRRIALRRRALLIGSGALVLVAAAVYATGSLSAQPPQQQRQTAGAAAMTLPSSLTPLRGGIATLPAATGASSRPSSKPSATAYTSHSAAAKQKDTAAAQAPGSSAGSDNDPATASGASPAAAAPAAVAPVTAPSTAQQSAPPPVGDWLLNQTVGNTAIDSTGAHNATAENGWWTQNGNGCLLNGTNTQIYTDGPVLYTGAGQSFTVSAWVYMKALPASGTYDETAVSQDSGEDSGFYLQYTEPADRWAFSRVADNGENPAAYRALSASAPSLSTWTHLVGVYNAGNHTQYLYVNGVEQGTATDPTPFSSNGDLVFGRAQYNGQDADWLNGAILKVEVFDAALTPSEVSSLS